MISNAVARDYCDPIKEMMHQRRKGACDDVHKSDS